jgi:hypothetical protein
MALRHMVQKSFVLLRSDLSVDEGLARVNRLKPAMVIVHRTDYRDLNYLFSTSEILQFLLRSSDKQMPLYKALDLHERDRTPTFNPSITIPIDKLPSKTIVVEDVNVVGFIAQPGGAGRGGFEPDVRKSGRRLMKKLKEDREATRGGGGADIEPKATGTEELT